MGKFNSIVTFTGKVDQIVGMKGANGETYARKNAIPRNPNTTAQVEQRTKMSLAGQLSKITPRAAIYGMGSSNQKRRSAFTANIARKAGVVFSDGSAVAQLLPADLVFSEGLGRNMDAAIAASFANNKLTVTGTPADFPEDVDAVVVVAVFSENRTGNYHEVMMDTITREDPSVVFDSADNTANVYYIPVLQAEGASRASYLRAIANIEASDSYTTSAEVLTSGVFKYAASEYHSSKVNTPQA